MRFLFTLMCLVSTHAMAESNIVVPPKFKDSTIDLKLASGEIKNFDGNLWMVVRRHGPVAAPAVVPAPAPESPTEDLPMEYQASPSRAETRIRLLAGYGIVPKVRVKQRGNTFEASVAEGLVLGLGIERKLDNDLSLCAEALTSGTFLLCLGAGL